MRTLVAMNILLLVIYLVVYIYCLFLCLHLRLLPSPSSPPFLPPLPSPLFPPFLIMLCKDVVGVSFYSLVLRLLEVDC